MNQPTTKSPHSLKRAGDHTESSVADAARDAALKLDAPWPIDHPKPDSLQAEYDALADLFLNDAQPAPVVGTIGIAGPQEVKPIAPAPSAKPKAAAPSPAALSPAAPQAPAAKPAAAPKAPSTSSASGTETPKATAPVIEALILGHLPVLAAAWAVQYARHIAVETGQPVALARVNAGSISLDAIFPDADQAAAARPGLPLADTAQSLARAAMLAPRLLIRVDETAEPDLPNLPSLDRITLLTGCDDMAVVSCYRTLKHLCQDSPTGEATAPVGIAIMGAEHEKALGADQKLRRAALTFLAKGLEPATIVSRMDVCAQVHIHRGTWDSTVGELLTIARDLWANRPTSRSTGRKPRAAGPPADVGASAVATSRAASLARHIVGLTPLTSRCPYCPGVELACGEDGSLHLVAGIGSVGTYTEASQAVGQLLAAASWADDHAQLLAAAHTPLNPGQSAPVLHLMTDEPKAARAVLGTGIRVHLLKQISLDGRLTWVCNDLN